MPDVHSGKGCTIGSTMTILDKVVPNIVGVDIGCGMLTINIGKEDIDFEKLDAAAHYIPSGMPVWEGRKEKFDLESLRCYRDLNKTKWMERSLGTLGGGNHFIEVDEAMDGTKYLIIHKGSRNLGKQVAEIYQHLAVDLNKGKETYFQQRDEIIRIYKEQGRRNEIQAALKQTGLTGTDAFHTIHNYIDFGNGFHDFSAKEEAADKMILRKGAISAKKGEKVLIPINMRDGSVLAIGKGNPEWNYSAPHGAGRVMSRTKAKESLSLDEYKETMSGVYTTSVNEATLDEAPMAYKRLEDIIDVIKESVDVIDVMKPIYNFKAFE